MPSECREWSGERVLALACDPDRDARSIRLALGAQHGRPTHELGIGQLVGVEPLQPGETLEPPVVASGPDGLRGRAAGPARGDPRLLSTTLTHRYRPSSDFDRTRLVVHARVLLVRDAQGIWRLTAVEPLLPLVAVTHRHRDGFVLSLPQALERPATVTLRIERGEISYSDDARLAG